MILQLDNTALRSYLANVQVEAGGEPRLAQKLAPHLAAAEAWLTANILTEELLAQVAAADAQPLAAIRTQLMAYCAYAAYASALPMLDVVLTPNGFAVVGNATLTPASRPRIDRLAASLRSLADDALDSLVGLLRRVDDWRTSPMGDWFGASLFPQPSLLLRPLGEPTAWTRFAELRTKAIDIEDSLAEEFISPELMAAMRQGSLAATTAQPLLAPLRRQVVAVIAGNAIDCRRMADLVNYIRQRPDEYPQWHSSATALLFQPNRFVNTKEARGYFF